jgi:hypothetical protein
MSVRITEPSGIATGPSGNPRPLATIRTSAIAVSSRRHFRYPAAIVFSAKIPSSWAMSGPVMPCDAMIFASTFVIGRGNRRHVEAHLISRHDAHRDILP